MLAAFHLDQCLQLIYPEYPSWDLEIQVLLVMNLNKLLNIPKLELSLKCVSKIKQKKMVVELQRDIISANILGSPSLTIFEIVFLTDFLPLFFLWTLSLSFPSRFHSFPPLTFSKNFTSITKEGTDIDSYSVLLLFSSKYLYLCFFVHLSSEK